MKEDITNSQKKAECKDKSILAPNDIVKVPDLLWGHPFLTVFGSAASN